MTHNKHLSLLYFWSKVNAAGQERALRIREKKTVFTKRQEQQRDEKRYNFLLPTKNCLHVITDNYEKTFFGPPFHSVKNYETIEKIFFACYLPNMYISNFKCQIEFESSQINQMKCFWVKLKSLDYHEEACHSWHLKMCWK